MAGGAAAALVAAGVGCAAFGIAVVLAESVAAVKQAFTLSTAVGPLSGKAVVAVVVYALVWLALHLIWRRTSVAFDTVFRCTTALVAVGVIATFPPVYGLIAGH